MAKKLHDKDAEKRDLLNHINCQEKVQKPLFGKNKDDVRNKRR